MTPTRLLMLGTLLLAPPLVAQDPVGIDFSGGTIIVVKFDQAVTEDQVRQAS